METAARSDGKFLRRVALPQRHKDARGLGTRSDRVQKNEKKYRVIPICEKNTIMVESARGCGYGYGCGIGSSDFMSNLSQSTPLGSASHTHKEEAPSRRTNPHGRKSTRGEKAEDPFCDPLAPNLRRDLLQGRCRDIWYSTVRDNTKYTGMGHRSSWFWRDFTVVRNIRRRMCSYVLKLV